MHDWFRPPVNRLAGRAAGVSLNDDGRREAEQVAQRLDPHQLDWIVASPLQRTVETAEIIAHRRGLEVRQDERFIEWALGPWKGMRVEDIQARYPDQWRTWRENPIALRLPGAETLEQVADRMETAFMEWLDRGVDGAIVSHQDPLAALLCRLVGMPLANMRALEIGTGSVSVVRRSVHGDVVEAVNSGVPLI